MNSFESMVDRNKHKKLTLYIQQQHHSTPSSSSSATTSITTTSSSSSNQNHNTTQIVLLQHYSEKSKKTATGWLLNDTLYSDKFGTTPLNKNDLVETRMKVTIWTWRGTNDIAMIDEQIMRLLKDGDRAVHLLWTGGTTTTTTDVTTTNAIMTKRSNNTEKAAAAETFIIIDGTWQQARKIYRKVPMLWSLPRISFNGTNVPPSTYVLRGDYSGWRERFSSSSTTTNNDGGGDGGNNDLLCTAEVAAAVMDRCGDGDCANVIRRRLDVFQSTFSHNNNNNNNNDN